MAAAVNPSMYAQVVPGLIIGNLESIDDFLASYSANIDKSPLTDTTAIINLSTIAIDHRRVPGDIQYLSQSQTPEEPYDGSFDRVAASMMKVVEVLLAPMINNGHTVLLVCESGRRVSAMVAVLYILTTRGGDSQKIYDNITYAYMNASERTKHAALHAQLESHRWDAKDAAAVIADISAEEKAFYDRMQQTRVCLSPQYRKLLLYHIESAQARA